MFENALRKKFRFPTDRGSLSTEELFDLPLTSRNGFDLDTVAKNVHRQVKEQGEISFVNPGSGSLAGKRLEEMLAVVVHVIAIKQDIADKAKNAAKRADERRQLTEILHIRSQQDLMAKSPEELQAMLAALDKDDAPEAAPATE